MFKVLDGGPDRARWRGALIFPESYFGPSVPLSGNAVLKVWNGSAWVVKPMKYWNGSAWVLKPLKMWLNGSWITTT